MSENQVRYSFTCRHMGVMDSDSCLTCYLSRTGNHNAAGRPLCKKENEIKPEAAPIPQQEVVPC